MSEYAIKVRMAGCYELWEDISPFAIAHGKEALSILLAIILDHPKVYEVRTNEVGSLQGHYYRGKATLEEHRSEVAK